MHSMAMIMLPATKQKQATRPLLLDCRFFRFALEQQREATSEIFRFRSATFPEFPGVSEMRKHSSSRWNVSPKETMGVQARRRSSSKPRILMNPRLEAVASCNLLIPFSMGFFTATGKAPDIWTNSSLPFQKRGIPPESHCFPKASSHASPKKPWAFRQDAAPHRSQGSL
jgi:hypothetical protein